MTRPSTLDGVGSVVHLTEAQRDNLRAAATVPAYRVEDLDGPLLDRIKDAKDCLGPEAAGALRAFTGESNDRGALLVRNVPIDEELPETPQDGRPARAKATRVSETALLLVMSWLGDPIGYVEEKDGRLVHDVAPKPGREHEQENTGSDFFDVHTENAFHPFKPDFIGLLCLRQDHERVAKTMVASARESIPLLREEDVQELRKPLFQHRVPSSFATSGTDGVLSRPAPVLSGPPSNPEIVVDAFNTVPLSERASAALTALLGALRSGLDGWALEPGDLLVIDNRHAVHARTSFVPRYDGRDRWLQRVYAVEDLGASSAVRRPGSHVCAGLVTSR